MLDHVGVTWMEKATIQSIAGTSAEVFKLDLEAANEGMKSAFYRFLEMTLMNMFHLGTWNTHWWRTLIAYLTQMHSWTH